MGDFTKRMYGKKDAEIPGHHSLKIRMMANLLPPMAVKVEGDSVQRVGAKFVPSVSNRVDHYANLKELYYATGISGCQEYFDKIMARKAAVVREEMAVKYRKLPFWERVGCWFVRVLGWGKK